MNIQQAFPSNYLKADDLGGDTTYTIKSIEIVMLGQGNDAEEKPVVQFRESEKGIVLNLTNANTISDLYGPETNDWVGKRITLYSAKVQFGKKLVDGIRIRGRGEQSQQQKAPSTAQHGDAAKLRAEALMGAWNKFKGQNPGVSPDELKAKFATAHKAYFNGRPHQAIGQHEWDSFASDNFVKPPPPENPFEGEPETFKDDASIPF